MSICTLTQLKTRLGIDASVTSQDDLLNQIITGVAAAFEHYCMRRLVRPAADITEHHPGGERTIMLKLFPAITITSVTEALYGEHDSATALTANSDYQLSDARGNISRIGCRWLCGLDAVKIVYTGGYTAAGSTPGADEIAMPDAIIFAAVTQCSYVFQRKDELGLKSVSLPQGSISTYGTDGLLKSVRDLLGPYRRILI